MRIDAGVVGPAPALLPEGAAPDPGTLTVYISIGNSDDKLSQRDWATFVERVDGNVRWHGRVHGAWFSAPASPWQNACWCVELEQEELADSLRQLLTQLRIEYRQDSVAWAEVPRTEFI